MALGMSIEYHWYNDMMCRFTNETYKQKRNLERERERARKKQASNSLHVIQGDQVIASKECA